MIFPCPGPPHFLYVVIPSSCSPRAHSVFLVLGEARDGYRPCLGSCKLIVGGGDIGGGPSSTSFSWITVYLHTLRTLPLPLPSLLTHTNRTRANTQNLPGSAFRAPPPGALCGPFRLNDSCCLWVLGTHSSTFNIFILFALDLSPTQGWAPCQRLDHRVETADLNGRGDMAWVQWNGGCCGVHHSTASLTWWSPKWMYCLLAPGWDQFF